MPVENVRLTVRDWDGTLRHERYLEHVNPALWVNIPANGVECSRDGYGNCLEATWAAYAGTLGAEPRDIVEIDSLVGGVWARDFAGVLLKSGNMQATDQRSNFKLVGLKKRLQEVRVVNDVLEGDVAAQARTALQDVIASGQLGNAVIFDAALMPDAGVILSGFKARGRRISDLLDYLAAQAGGVWGVNADRKVYLRKRDLPGDTLDLVEDVGTIVRWEDTDSEALATAINFILGYAHDGTLFEYLYPGPDVTAYGYAWKDVTFEASRARWLVQQDVTAYTFDATNKSGATTDAILYDGVLTSSSPDSVILAERETDVIVRVTARQASQRITAQYQVGGSVTTLTRVRSGARLELYRREETGSALAPPRAVELLVDIRAGDEIELRVANQTPGTTMAGVLLVEFRLDYLDPDFFGRLAEFHYRLPGRDPATITASGRVTPRSKLSLVRSRGSTYETSIEMLTYRLTLDRDPETVIRAGQREAAEVAAQRWLGQLALADATVQAVRVTS